MATATKKTNKKAITIAKDVLKQLKKLKLVTGVFLRPLDGGFRLPTIGDLKPLIEDVQKNCMVCQKGALLLSKARVYNDVPCKKAAEIMSMLCEESTVIKDLLEGYIDRESMDLLEAAFELEIYSWMNDTTPERINAAIEFGEKYKTLTGRVKACMNNMLENKGYFMPEKGPAKRQKKVKKQTAK